MARIGVVSDTHGFFDARLEELLAGVELILHAGDVDNQQVLDELVRIAPVRAVRGNVDPPQLGLPLRTPRGLEGFRWTSSISCRRLKLNWKSGQTMRGWRGSGHEDGMRFCGSFEPNTRVVVFGHSHAPCSVALAGKLFFNPGSAGKRRFSLPRSCGLLEVSPDGVEATIFSLERYNGKLPEKVRLPVGG